MVVAFALSIVVGVCGMIGFAGLTLGGVLSSPVRDSLRDAPEAYAAALADYYIANGGSWAGVERRLDAPPFTGSFSFVDYTLTDRGGRTVATTVTRPPRGMRMWDEPLNSAPVIARGERVGTLLVLRHSGPPEAWDTGRDSGPALFLRSFSVAGLALTVTLVSLGVLFSGWLSRPIRRLTLAAEELAGGKLDVQVRPAGVRELNELGQAFNRMARTLADADRQRRQMTADVAHELRTPLTIIKGRLEGLQDGVYQATPDQIGRLLEETALLERLIDDLRLLALAEAGQLQLYPEATSPAELLHDAAGAFAAQAAAHGVSISVEAPDDLQQLEVDPQRMAQVLANLVSNALRHTPPGGTIALRAATIKGGEGAGARLQDERDKRDERVERERMKKDGARDSFIHPSSFILLEVCDSGSGIPPEDLPHVFERLWSADRSRTRSSGGAGLGLAIAKQIVAAHGGSIRAESAPGQGTTISIVLPAAAPQPAA